MSSKKRKNSSVPVLDNEEWDERAEDAIDAFSSSDSEDLSSDGLVGDSASEASGSGSDDEGDLDKPALTDVEVSHLKKKAANSEPAEFSDPEYGYDSEDSENERTLHTIGDVPLKWYEDMDHIGYDLEGEKVARPKGEDAIDRFLALNDTSTGWKSVYDEKTGKRVVISDRDMEFIKRLQSGTSSDRYDAEKWFVPIATMNEDIHPTTGEIAPKRRFVPSKWEAQRIRQLAYAIRKGYIKLDDDKKKEEEEPQFFLIWEQDEMEESPFRGGPRIPPPKARLPGHAESYNPPMEYLFDEQELADWKEADPVDRRLQFIPKKFNNLRSVPGYEDFHKERFERCLDLYLCTRTTRTRTRVDMAALMPQLPKPAELRPFPITEMMQYNGHVGRVRSVSVDPTGQWLVSGGDDKTARVFEIQTSRCVQVWHFDDVVQSVAWNPSKAIALIAVATENMLTLVEPKCATHLQREKVHALLSDMAGLSESASDKIKPLLEWRKPAGSEWEDGRRLVIQYDRNTVGKDLKSMTWHHKGDYIATVSPTSNICPVLIHQLSKRLTQAPFAKSKSQVQCVKFHPTKPYFFVAVQRQIKVYNLVKQELVKKLLPGVQWISSMDIHPGGDNLIVGSYDKKVNWFDLDFSTKPYKTLRYHSHAVRAVKYHSKYPLFASASDDGSIQVFHGTVYDDLLTNPLIVPLKILRGHETVDDLGVLDVAFHPSQPWLFSCGADSTVRLYVH
jgi:ribosome biogenesis protein ERB1